MAPVHKHQFVTPQSPSRGITMRSENSRLAALRDTSRSMSYVCHTTARFHPIKFSRIFSAPDAVYLRGGNADRVTLTPAVVSPARCPTTTLANRAPILTDTLQLHTHRHLDLMRLIPTLQPLSLDMARPGHIIPMCHHSIEQPQRQPFPGLQRPAVRLRTLPTEEPVSQPPTRLRVTQTQ